jgi:hypothetical protein
MLNRYYIVDDFYDDPLSVRQHVLGTSTEGQSGGNYAGVMTDQALFTEQHLQVISALVQEPVMPGTSLNGRFRFSTEQDTFKQLIHFDYGEDLAWAGVIYLSPDHPAVAGTTFYRHNRTGLEEIPRTMEGIAAHGWHDTRDLQRFLETEGMDPSLWTPTLTVPYRFNRLILFRPWMFHAPGPAWGYNRADCRLIQTLFLARAHRP